MWEKIAIGKFKLDLIRRVRNRCSGRNYNSPTNWEGREEARKRDNRLTSLPTCIRKKSRRKRRGERRGSQLKRRCSGFPQKKQEREKSEFSLVRRSRSR